MPHAGRLTNEYLKKKLSPAGYYEVPHTPGLWKHIYRPVAFILVVDDFGIKYVGKEHANHLVRTLKRKITVRKDWDGSLYCGITLECNYAEGYLNFSMPGYIKNNR